MNFEPLREMEAFTNAMFDRIIAFQEGDQAAWKEDAAFDERIKGLPLHALVFSNPNRDPAKFGPTVSHFYPLREEMMRIAHFAQQLGENSTVLDVHTRNGFVGSLLAREGARVIGLRSSEEKPNQIKNFFDKENFELREGTLADIDFEVDIALSSWMPAGENMTPEILKLKPKMIVFIYTEHKDTSNDTPQTGTPEAFENLPEQYKLIDHWMIRRPKDLFHEIWPDLTPSIEEERHVKIFADEPYQNIKIPQADEDYALYDWEQELRMALLAHEAKNHLRAQGVHVR